MILKWIFFVFILPVVIWLVIVFSGCSSPTASHSLPEDTFNTVKKSRLGVWTVRYVEDPSVDLCFAVVEAHSRLALAHIPCWAIHMKPEQEKGKAEWVK